MKTLAFVGCGKLSDVVVNAKLNGLLPEYALVGAYSRNKINSQRLCEKVNDFIGDRHCVSCQSIDELLTLNPDYIVEAASPDALKEFIVPALKQGTSVITLSIGAFADKEFYEKVQEVAKKSASKVHIVSGAIGGFDVLSTLTLMGANEASFDTEKGAKSLRSSSIYDPELERQQKTVFEGTAVEAIECFPTQVNVAVAASLASVGPENMKVSMTSTPNYVGDEHKIRIQGNGIRASISVYSSTAHIAGWSVVSTLRNIVSPIKFG